MPQVSSPAPLQTACLRGIHAGQDGVEAVLALTGWQFLRVPLTNREAEQWRPRVGQAVQVDLGACRLRPTGESPHG